MSEFSSKFGVPELSSWWLLRDAIIIQIHRSLVTVSEMSTVDCWLSCNYYGVRTICFLVWRCIIFFCLYCCHLHIFQPISAVVWLAWSSYIQPCQIDWLCGFLSVFSCRFWTCLSPSSWTTSTIWHATAPFLDLKTWTSSFKSGPNMTQTPRKQSMCIWINSIQMNNFLTVSTIIVNILQQYLPDHPDLNYSLRMQPTPQQDTYMQDVWTEWQIFFLLEIFSRQMMLLVSPVKLQPLFRILAFLYIFYSRDIYYSCVCQLHFI